MNVLSAVNYCTLKINCLKTKHSVRNTFCPYIEDCRVVASRVSGRGHRIGATHDGKWVVLQWNKHVALFNGWTGKTVKGESVTLQRNAWYSGFGCRKIFCGAFPLDMTCCKIWNVHIDHVMMCTRTTKELPVAPVLLLHAPSKAILKTKWLRMIDMMLYFLPH